MSTDDNGCHKPLFYPCLSVKCKDLSSFMQNRMGNRNGKQEMGRRMQNCTKKLMAWGSYRFCVPTLTRMTQSSRQSFSQRRSITMAVANSRAGRVLA